MRTQEYVPRRDSSALGLFFLIYSAILCLLIGEFNLFTFKVIIDRLATYAILLIVF